MFVEFYESKMINNLKYSHKVYYNDFIINV